MIVGKNFALRTDHKPRTRAFFRIYAEKAAGIHRRRDKYSGIPRRFVDIDIVLLVGGKTSRSRARGLAPHASGITYRTQHPADIPLRDPRNIDKTGSQHGSPEKG